MAHELFALAKWLENIELLSKKDVETEWPAKKLELDAAYSNVQAEYEGRRLEAEKNWIDAETKRSAWAKRLVDGDVEALEDAVADTMTDSIFLSKQSATLRCKRTEPPVFIWIYRRLRTLFRRRVDKC